MPEPVSLILGAATEAVLKKFGKHVIERWSKHRAKNFVEAFFAAISQAKGQSDVSLLLDEIFSSDAKTEALFEAYRAVSMSRSRDIGPRAIGLLTAMIVNDDRRMTGFEERWFRVFETLNDDELLGIQEFYHHAFSRARSGDKDYRFKLNELEIAWADETTEFKAKKLDRSPLDLNEAIGSNAGELGQLGMIRTKMTEEVWDYGVDSDHHVDEPGTARKITHWIYLDLPDEEYAGLIAKAMPAKDIVAKVPPPVPNGS